MGIIVLIQIVILAMIAVFLGLRLYAVLGRRAEHEEEIVRQRIEAQDDEQLEREKGTKKQSAGNDARRAEPALLGFPPAIEQGLREISAIDRRFELLPFLEGAKGAYAMVLEAFWRGDRETLRELCDDDVYASFAGAIDARESAGESFENRLIRIEDTSIHSALLDGQIARISVRFVSDIASVTRDKDGNLIAGSLDDAIESRDIWTFSRDVTNPQPDWLLDETDAG